MGDMAIKPSLTVELDAKSRTALLQIQTISKSAFIVATVATTADIMNVFKGKPVKRIKKILKKDWEDVSTIAEGMNRGARNRIRDIAYSMSMSYSNDNELFGFWQGIAYAFDK